MIFYVLVGGMKGTTWVQIVKAKHPRGRRSVTTLWVLSKAGFSLSALLHTPRPQPSRRAVLGPGLEYGVNTVSSSTSSRWRWPSSSARRACRTS